MDGPPAIVLPGLRLRPVRNILFAVWTEPPTLAGVAEFKRMMRELRQAHPTGTGLLDVVVRGRPAFSDEVRRAVIDLVADRGPRDIAAAHVVLTPGFAGIAVRAFINTVVLLGRPAMPNRVFSEAAPASDWLAAHLNRHEPTQRWRAAELLTLIQQEGS